MRQLVFFLCALLALLQGRTASANWFPPQSLPKGLLRTGTSARTGPAFPVRMMLQSAAGLAALAVNESRGDELVWVKADPEMEEWGKMFMADHPEVADRGEVTPWDLAERLFKKGIVKGYILYKADESKEDPVTKARPGLDPSADIATSLSGLLGGLIVEESIEGDAKKRGLPLLMDVRGKTQQWCFDTYKEKLNRRMICVLDPKIIGVRDYAIAHKTFTLCGLDEPLTSALSWLDPLSPVLGWMPGDEFKGTKLVGSYGDFQTASSLAPNLTVLSAGAADAVLPKVPHVDPHKIDWADKRSTVTFMNSDGDNVAWAVTGFFHHDGYYWGNPERGKIPFGWGLPLAHLAQLAPEPIEYALKTRTPNDSFVEWHGGYYYPDLFASERPNRWELLAQHARDTWDQMKKTGVRMIGCNIRNLDSPDALKAYQTIAGQTDGLLAILAFQYSPYNGGQGKVYWVKDAKGIDLPVITLRYQIWWQMPKRENGGTPAKVARCIADSAKAAGPDVAGRNDWAMVHAWSYFKQAPGNDEQAEELPPKKSLPDKAAFEALGGVRGYAPVLWCAERLPDSVRIVPPEEMAWRARMTHNPEQTKKLITDFQP